MRILQRRDTGSYVLHPMGTFAGHGGFIGIGPYRELGADADAAALALTVTHLLDASGPTGYRIQDIVRYQREQLDPESMAVASRHFPHARATDALIAQDYKVICVHLKKGQKSWAVVPHVYNKSADWFEEHPAVRVAIATGVRALGEAVRLGLNAM